MERFDLCSKCEVPCCNKGNPYLHKDELKFLPKIKVKKIKGDLVQHINGNGKPCVFLKDNKCSLQRKPLACRVYPFILIKGEWYVRTRCPLWNEFNKEDLERTKNVFERNKKYFGDKK